MGRIVHTNHSNHTFFVQKVTKSDLPKKCDPSDLDNFKTFYAVKNFDEKGHTFMYLARGHEESPNEVVVFYPNGKMWYSFGKNIKEAIEGGQKNGWMYCD